MAGVLSFALGLETSAFASALDAAGSRLIAFIGVGKLAEAVFAGVWAAIERGGQLVDLSNRTGVAVASLYQLQEAFKAVGLDANAVPSVVNRLQKSLSGIGEMGESTKEAFDALGLSMTDLKGMDSAKALQAVVAAMNQLPQGQRLDAAIRIFGRENGQNIVQLSRDTEEFGRVMADSAGEAAVFSRTAAAFDNLGDTIARIKGHVSGMFAGIAEGVVPTLQSVADALKSIDLVAVGQNISTMMAGAFQAFQEGKISVLIADTIIFGFQAAVDMMPGIFGKLGAILLRIFEYPLSYLQAGLEYNIQRFLEMVANTPLLGASLGLDGFKAQSFDEVFAERQAAGLKFNYGTGEFGIDQVDAAASESMNDGLASVKNRWEGLFGEFADYASRAPSAAPAESSSTTDATSSVDTAGGGKIKKTDATALERMGFMVNGGAADIQRQTANNTRELVQINRRIENHLRPGPKTSTVND
jgi:hypothetical protein